MTTDREQEETATPMADHVARFWRYLETETVRILVDLQRDGYCDSSSFPDETAKAIIADHAALMRENESLRATISDMKRDLLELTGGKNDSTRI